MGTTSSIRRLQYGGDEVKQKEKQRRELEYERPGERTAILCRRVSTSMLWPHWSMRLPI